MRLVDTIAVELGSDIFATGRIFGLAVADALAHEEAKLVVYSSEWDLDPRELFEIPEASLIWVAAYYTLLSADFNMERLDPESFACMQLCVAAREGKAIEWVEGGDDSHWEVRG